MSLNKVAFLLSVLCMLSGCAVMDEGECKVADWRTVGIEEGMRGSDISSIGEYRKACAEYGISPNLAAYQAGHQQGIKQFCSPQKAFHWGASGQALPSVCPGNVHPNFLSQHDRGLRSYCTVDTAFNLGKSGSTFPRICPQELTKKLSFSFDRGKKVYQELKAYRNEVEKMGAALEGVNEKIHTLEHQHDEHIVLLEAAQVGIYSKETTDKQKVAFYRQREQSQALLAFVEHELAGLFSDKDELQYGINAIEMKIDRTEKISGSYLLE